MSPLPVPLSIQAKAELEDAQLSYRRNEQLVAKGFVAQSTLDASEARYKGAKAAVAAQVAAIRAAEAALEEAKVLVEYANIRAPFDGVVLTKSADIGTLSPAGRCGQCQSRGSDHGGHELAPGGSGCL